MGQFMDKEIAKLETKIEKQKEFIKWLADNFKEKRSDVTELCNQFLAGVDADENMIEKRFVRGYLPNGVEVEYDTLTTLMEYREPAEQWKPVARIGYYDTDEE